MIIIGIIGLVIDIIFKVIPYIFSKPKLEKIHEAVSKAVLELKGQ